MDVILLQDVEKLGEKGQVVSVSDGYVRNYLMPRKLAEAASPGRIAEVRKRQEAAESKNIKDIERAGDLAELLSKTVLTIEAQAGEDGRLFGSVTNTDIAEALKAQGFEVAKADIRMPEGHLKQIGDYPITIALHHDATAKITVSVLGAS